MEKYRLSPNLKSSFSQVPTFETLAPPNIITQKTQLREPPIPSYLRPEPPKQPTTPRDRLGRRADDTEISIFDAERYFNGVPDSRDNAKPRTIILEGIAERCDLSANPRESSVSSVDGRNHRDGPLQATPTASSEASWNSQSGLLKNPPGSALVNVRAFPQYELRKSRSSSSSSGRRRFRLNCRCFGSKSVDTEEKFSEPKSPIRSNHDANKQSSKTEQEEFSKPPKSPFSCNHDPNKRSSGAGEEEKMEKVLGIEEVRELKIVAGNRSKDPVAVHGSGRFSPGKKLQAEIGCRIVNSGRPYKVGGGFSFPILTPPATNILEDPARDSLEVFQPAEEMAVSRKPAEFHRRVPAMPISGNGDHRSFTSRTADDDSASETSSELFEIESFSTQMTYRRRDSLDELLMGGLDPRRAAMRGASGILEFRRSVEEAASTATPSIAPSECYPPSEVSVEWSVTTAEGFDRGSVANFSSAASEYEDLLFIQAENDRFAAAVDAGGGKRWGSGLLGCVSEKAVIVGPPQVCYPEARRAGAGNFSVQPDRVRGWRG